jgi:hypothetical protein
MSAAEAIYILLAALTGSCFGWFCRGAHERTLRKRGRPAP